MIKAIKAAVNLLCIGIPKTSPGTYSTTNSWSIKGVPLIIHTKVRASHLNGLNLDILPRVMISPSGIAATKVTIKSIKFWPKPSNNVVIIDIVLGLIFLPLNKHKRAGRKSFPLCTFVKALYFHKIILLTIHPEACIFQRFLRVCHQLQALLLLRLLFLSYRCLF